MKRAVLFDFDLTLADSARGVIECVNYALMEMDLPRADHAAIRAAIGLSLPATLARLTGLTDPVSANVFATHFVQRADLMMVDLTSLFPDVCHVVPELRKAGMRTGIVSTKYRYRIEAILARGGLADAFDVIVGGEDVLRHKPDPEGLHRALRCIGISGRDAVYVGDHPVDAMAASAARISFVAALSGNAVRGDFDPWPGTAFIERLSDIVSLLTAHGGTSQDTERRSRCSRHSYSTTSA